MLLSTQRVWLGLAGCCGSYRGGPFLCGRDRPLCYDGKARMIDRSWCADFSQVRHCATSVKQSSDFFGYFVIHCSEILPLLSQRQCLLAVKSADHQFTRRLSSKKGMLTKSGSLMQIFFIMCSHVPTFTRHAILYRKSNTISWNRQTFTWVWSVVLTFAR